MTTDIFAEGRPFSPRAEVWESVTGPDRDFCAKTNNTKRYYKKILKVEVADDLTDGIRVHRAGRVVAHAVNRFDNDSIRGRKDFATKTKIILVLRSIATMRFSIFINAEQIESELLRGNVVVLI